MYDFARRVERLCYFSVERSTSGGSVGSIGNEGEYAEIDRLIEFAEPVTGGSRVLLPGFYQWMPINARFSSCTCGLLFFCGVKVNSSLLGPLWNEFVCLSAIQHEVLPEVGVFRVA